MKGSHVPALRRLADEVLEVPDLDGLTRLLTRSLPETLDVGGASLLLWDRKLESFEGLAPEETRIHAVRPGGPEIPAPDARYLLSDGEVLETPTRDGEGTLVPLMARSGLVGMLVLGGQRRRQKKHLSRPEARLLSLLAARSALALENHLYQKELIETERMAALGTMAGMLAHDFRGPMTVIRGYAETLLDPTLPGAEIRSRAELILQNVDRLERMTAETLDFARGKERLVRRAVLLSFFLQDLASGLARELPGLEVLTDLRLPPGSTAALDVDKLRRAVGNIAANARDAMGGRGRLHVEAWVEPGERTNGLAAERLVLVVSDEGPGVAESIRERVFEPFTTFGKKKGTGLGLAVARRFVEDHEGSVELLPASDAPARGARFRITLPLVAREATGAGSGAL
jgi:signal transduction histidine kinase